jgi:putative hydrolase
MVQKAFEKDILIELNNSSLAGSRSGSDANCKNIAKLCMEYGVKIIIGSDAHTCFHIGEFSLINSMLEEIKMPEELIMNNDEFKLLKYLRKKGKLE